MTGKSKSSICFVCLKSFKNSDTHDPDHGGGEGQKRTRNTAGKGGSSSHQDQGEPREDDDNDCSLDLFGKFARVLSDYLQLAQLGVDLNSFYKNTPGFCSTCAGAIGTICEVYEELQAVEIRLGSKLGELGQLMEKPNKFSEALSKSLAEQLMMTAKKGGGRGGASFLQKLRDLIASKMVVKGKEVAFNKEDFVLDKTQFHPQEGTKKKDTRITDNQKQGKDDDEGGAGGGSEAGQIVIKTEVLGDEIGPDSPIDDSMDHFDDSYLDNDDDLPGIELKPVPSINQKDLDESHADSSKSDSDSGSDWAESPSKKTKKRKLKPRGRKPVLNSKSPKALASKRAKVKYREAAPAEIQDPNASYHCQQCGRGFDKYLMFWKHLSTKHEDKVEEKNIHCPFCWMSFAFKQTYTLHLETRHEYDEMTPVLSCDDTTSHCPASFSSISDLNCHLQTHSSSSIHHCSTCNWGFLNAHLKELHELVHIRSLRGNFTCPKCSSVSTSLAKLQEHYNSSHGAQLELHQCPKCSVTCLSKASLEIHMNRSHVFISPQCCDVCGKMYDGENAARELKRHITVMHNAVEIPCNFCDETFVLRKQLDKHMRTKHEVMSRVPCQHCGKALANKNSLREHMKQVHGEGGETSSKNKQLCPHCGSTFANVERHILLKHHDLMAGEGKHRCDGCGEKFHHMELLTRHKRSCQNQNHKEDQGIPVTVADVPGRTAASWNGSNHDFGTANFSSSSYYPPPYGGWKG
ncbi:unnamed protein product [Orchesella dallaii]|uniref:C2H2-type domain-containing protein n=1 Tax=Orchesella dallaii TaxID=48710 RepID=A0ABP1RHM7_9HEXA